MNRDTSFLARATRVRFGVLAFGCALAMITYLDRACFSVAESYLREALKLENIHQLGPAIWAFNLAYAIFEVPSGWLGDVYGPRRTLIRIVLWWSFFTMLTALAGLAIAGLTLVNLLVLVVIRFLFGVGEAGAYPNLTRALHNWFPRKERGSAQGAIWFFSRLSGGLTPFLLLALIEWIGVPWRSVFVLFGILGIAWCLAFAFWFRNHPAENPAVNEAERHLIAEEAGHETEAAHAGVPWGRLLASPTLWALCLMYFCMSYAWYFNLSYLPAFLEEQHGVRRDDTLGSLYKGGPLIFGAVSCLLGGWLSDWFIRRTGNRVWGRRIFGIIGHGICAPCYIYCIFAPTAFTFALSLALAGFFNDLAMGSAWAACQDIGRKYSAIVAGCMNTVGNLGGFAAIFATASIIGFTFNSYMRAHDIDPKKTEEIVRQARATLEKDAAQPPDQQLSKDERQKLEDEIAAWNQAKRNGNLPGYNLNFIISAAVYGLSVLLWFGVNATRPVVPDAAEANLPAGVGEHFPRPPDDRIGGAVDEHIHS
jgi:MFS transporter, ACS family, glucarate transporter